MTVDQILDDCHVAAKFGATLQLSADDAAAAVMALVAEVQSLRAQIADFEAGGVSKVVTVLDRDSAGRMVKAIVTEW